MPSDRPDHPEGRREPSFDSRGIPPLDARDDPGFDDTERMEHFGNGEGQDAPKRPWRKRLLVTLVAASALFGFIGIAWYALNEGQRDSDAVVPVIRADIEPEKSRPEDPGGMTIPHRDRTVFERIDPLADQPRVERLLPPPEVPQERPAPTAEVPPVSPIPEAIAEAAPDTAAAPPPAPPARVAEEASPPSEPAPLLPPPPPARTPAPEAATPAPPAPAPAPAAPPATAPAQALAQPYMIQLGALRDQARAEQEAQALTTRHAAILGTLRVGATRADLGERGIFYRLQAGPVEGREAAEALCARLSATGQSCLAVRP